MQNIMQNANKFEAILCVFFYFIFVSGCEVFELGGFFVLLTDGQCRDVLWFEPDVVWSAWKNKMKSYKWCESIEFFTI